MFAGVHFLPLGARATMAGYGTVQGERHAHIRFASATHISNTTAAMLGKHSQLLLTIKLLTTFFFFFLNMN